MAIATALCTSFKVELMKGIHNFAVTGGDTFKLSLFTSTATLGASTTAYATPNESSGTGYTAGGVTLTRTDPVSSGTTAYTDFADVSWASSTFTANGCLIYNSTDSNVAVSSHAFGGDVSTTSGTFSLVFPTPDTTNAIVRLA